MKILVYTANPSDGCSFYRGIGPWSALAKKYRYLNVQYCLQNVAWGEVRQADILFLLRPSQNELMVAAEAAKDFGVKLWVDFDDDLLNVPSDNHAFQIYGNAGIRKNIEQYIRLADLVTVSTEHLKKQFSQFNSNVRVVPNACDNDLMKWPRADGAQNNFVVWRGSPTHDRDVASVAEEIVRVAEKHSAYTFIFLGADPVPYRCSEKIAKVVRVPLTSSITRYFKTLIGLKPTLLINPLHDHVFNHSKSCIAGLEAAMAGAACIGPDFEEWRIPGMITYKDAKDFGVMLDSYLGSSQAPAKKAKEMLDYVQEQRTLLNTNAMRVDLAHELTGWGQKINKEWVTT